MISQNLLFSLFFMLPCMLAVTYNYTGTLLGNQTFKVFSYPVPPGYNFASIQFKVYNTEYSNLIAVPSFTNNFRNLSTYSISALIISEDPLLTQMDVISAIGGYSQIINMVIPSPYPTLIYVALYNFDSPEVTTAKFFYNTLRYNLNYVICRSCPAGSKVLDQQINDLSCQCTPCSLNRVGVSCQYTLNPLLPDSIQRIDVFKNKDIYYIIKNTGTSVKLSIKELTNLGTITMYMQYEYRWGLIAGKLNNHYVNQTIPLIFTFSSNESTIQIQNLFDYDILLTVKNLGTSLGTVSIKYISEASKDSSSLTVVLAVVFSLVGAAVLFLIIFKAVSLCRSRNAIVLHINYNNLTSQQVDKYFPQVKATSLLRPSSEVVLSDDSISDLLQSNFSSRIFKYQCSICFENIKIEDLIRVTYCRHIFHSKCLVQWFNKSQNCPNCRMSSEYEETKSQRKVFTKIEKRKPQFLIRAILGSKFLEELKENGFIRNEVEKKELDKLDQKDFQIQADKKTEKVNESRDEQF